MNKTKIEWCDRTWNTVTGCLHNCNYCYARNFVNRFGNRRNISSKCHEVTIAQKLNYFHVAYKQHYPFGFDPTFHRYRLSDPQRVKESQNVFVCSMADLFGEWVPDEWIEAVFEACVAAPQHRYLFLTKNPKRYEQFITRYMPSNMWFGWTQTKPCGLSFQTHHSWNAFLSLEPLQAEFDFPNPQFDWVIIGSETGNRKGKIIPERKWIENIVNACQEHNIPVFLKNSLAKIWGEPLIQEYPW